MIAVSAVLALAAVGASSASAYTPQELTNAWYTGSPATKLVGTQGLQTKSVGTTRIESYYAGYPMTIISTGLECAGCVIENSGSEAKLKGSLTLTGVKIETAPPCETSSSIKFYPIVGTVFYNPSFENGIEIRPDSGTALATIKLSGVLCPLTGQYKIAGSLVGKFNYARGFILPEQGLTFNAEIGGSLRFGGEPAKYVGAWKTSLSSGLEFGLKEK